MGIEENGEIVAGMASAPELGRGTRWWAYRGEGAYRNGHRIHVSKVARLRRAGVHDGHGPSKDMEVRAMIRRLADAARSSRSIGGFWQHMLVAEGAADAALDWVSKAVGPGAAGPYCGRGPAEKRVPLTASARFTRTIRQHEWLAARRGAEDFPVRGK